MPEWSVSPEEIFRTDNTPHSRFETPYLTYKMITYGGRLEWLVLVGSFGRFVLSFLGVTLFLTFRFIPKVYFCLSALLQVGREKPPMKRLIFWRSSGTLLKEKILQIFNSVFQE